MVKALLKGACSLMPQTACTSLAGPQVSCRTKPGSVPPASFESMTTSCSPLQRHRMPGSIAVSTRRTPASSAVGAFRTLRLAAGGAPGTPLLASAGSGQPHKWQPSLVTRPFLALSRLATADARARRSPEGDAKSGRASLLTCTIALQQIFRAKGWAVTTTAETLTDSQAGFGVSQLIRPYGGSIVSRPASMQGFNTILSTWMGNKALSKAAPKRARHDAVKCSVVHTLRSGRAVNVICKTRARPQGWTTIQLSFPGRRLARPALPACQHHWRST
mmetsp:Transcript_36038/g.99954  ORF Transcript_36038/g.99954 Transcript_36038/m.99954 type:complete len:275 (-) Transcript_36038:154-978(-)